MRRALAAPALETGRLGTVPLLVIALGGLLALRLAALAINATDLFFDEAQYWSWAQTPALVSSPKAPSIAILNACCEDVSVPPACHSRPAFPSCRAASGSSGVMHDGLSWRSILPHPCIRRRTDRILSHAQMCGLGTIES